MFLLVHIVSGAVPFYIRDGILLVDAALFKSLMIVTGSLTAAVFMIWFFTIVNSSYTARRRYTRTMLAGPEPGT